jgi:hypothetical protein
VVDEVAVPVSWGWLSRCGFTGLCDVIAMVGGGVPDHIVKCVCM